MPAGAEALREKGHTVFVEQGAGLGSGFPDTTYEAAGATILPTADEVWQRAEMIMKVKEPIAVEWPRMKRGHARGDRLRGGGAGVRDGRASQR